jgi:hypothetical protein
MSGTFVRVCLPLLLYLEEVPKASVGTGAFVMSGAIATL